MGSFHVYVAMYLKLLLMYYFVGTCPSDTGHTWQIHTDRHAAMESPMVDLHLTFE